VARRRARPQRAARHPRQAPPDAHRRFPGVAALALVVVLAGVAAYATSFAGVFVFDDREAIVLNPHVRTLWPLTTAMSAPADVTVSARPVAALTLALDHALAPADVRDVMAPGRPADPPDTTARFLENVRGYHRTNLAIHLLAALALFGVVRRTLRSPRLAARFGSASTGLAFATALIWVLHPLQTEAVTYIVQRVESLMGLFYLLTLYCAIRAREEHHRAWWAGGAVAACALGMGSKEVMVSAPIMVWLWDWTFGRSEDAPDTRAPRRWPLYAGLASTWVLLGWLVASGGRSQSVGALVGWTPWSYLMTEAGVVVHYLRLAVLPVPLVLDYAWPRAPSLWSVAPQAVALVALLAATVVALVRRWPAGFLGAWCVAILAPTSSVLPIVTEVAAEHRMYLPLAAIVAGLVAGVWVLTGAFAALAGAGRGARLGLGLSLLAAVAVTFGVMTSVRNRDYWSDEGIWLDTVQKRPANGRARVSYAMDLYASGRVDEAEGQLQTAVGLDPANAAAHLNLGAILCQQGKLDDGIAHLRRTLALDPSYAQADQDLGQAYATQGHLDLAVEYFGRAVDLRPDDPRLAGRLAWLLATAGDDRVRDGARAAQLAERAIRLMGRPDATALDTLAAAYAEVGRFDAAATAASQALALARAGRQDALAGAIEARLALYRAHRKFRQPPG
jgi:protein O-mannosyl-transferase